METTELHWVTENTKGHVAASVSVRDCPNKPACAPGWTVRLKEVLIVDSTSLRVGQPPTEH